MAIAALFAGAHMEQFFQGSKLAHPALYGVALFRLFPKSSRFSCYVSMHGQSYSRLTNEESERRGANSVCH